MPAICPSCGRETPAASLYCPSCGRFLSAAPTFAPGAPSAAHKETTLRPVTVLFCDIKGSTEMISRLPSEAALKILSAATDAMAAAVHAAGGTVLKRLGDGVMAVFGVPVGQPDHALRACRAGLDIVERVAAAFASDPAIERHRPRVRIGLNSGEVAFSMDHPTVGQTELDVIGDQVSLAARVESAAKPDTVYITEATYRRVRGAVRAEFAESRMLDGFSTAVTLYRLWAVTTPNQALADERLRFVGRSRELEELRQFLSQLREGRGGAFVIFGEPGIGKTRLLEELRRDADSTELTWLRAGSPPLSENISYWAVSELLRPLLGTQGQQANEPDWETFLGVVKGILGVDNNELDPKEAGALLARILRIKVPEPWNGQLAAWDAEATYRQTLRVWWRFFDALAAQRPMVLEFDDLQWVDPASAGVISHILPLARERQIAIIGCGRSDDEGIVGRLVAAARETLGAQYRELRLGPLGSAETKNILSEVLGANPESIPVRQLVLSKSEGNPFFIEEIIRALKQMEILMQQPGGQWMLVCPIEQIRLPESLQELILARVDRLEEGLREVVRVAAVIGRQFLYRVLAAVSERSLDLDKKVRALQGQELIGFLHRFPELEYIFKHAVVQETIYASLFEERRRKIHRLVADSLESLFPAELEQFYAVLAYHYVRAEDWPKAQRYLFFAADQAHRLAADEDALRNFEEALTILNKVVGHQLLPLEIATIRRKLGNIQYRRGDLQASQAQYREGLRQLGLSDPTTRLGVRSRIGLELIRHVWSRLRFSAQLMKRSAVSDQAKEIFALFESLAWASYHQDQERLLLGMLRGLNLAERVGYLEGISKGCSALGYVLNTLRAFRLAAGYQERATAAARAADSAGCLGFAENIIGVHHFYQGRLAEAKLHYEEAQRQSRPAGDWLNWSSVRMQRAQVALVEGDLLRAFAIGDEMITQGREVALAPAISWGHLARGRALHLMADVERGRQDMLEAIARATSTLDYLCLAHAKGTLASMMLDGNDFSAARSEAIEAAALVDRHRLLGHTTVDVFVALARIGAYDLEQAVQRAVVDRIRAARHSCREAVLRAAKFLPAMPSALRVTGTVEWLSGRRTEAIRHWIESARLAEAIGAKLELAATLREHGIRVSDTLLRTRADEVLASIPKPTRELTSN